MAAQASSTFGSTPQSLLLRVKSRDHSAWFAFCELYAPLVYHWCRSSGLTHDQTEDLAQQVFGRLVTSIEHFERRETGSRFRAWLWTLTRNLIRDHQRNQLRRIRTIGGDAGDELISSHVVPNDCDDTFDLPDDADAMTSHGENRELFLRMLELVRDRHSERNWMAFWRVVVDGNDTAEVARDLTMSPNHVRQVKSRVLRQLRAEFGELLD
ncbi:MAG: RNA polymerase sigma factor [Planctomycetaceae bacterium]